MAQQKQIRLVSMKVQVRSLASTQWVKNLAWPMSCGVGHRQGSDSTSLWLWCILAATAPIPSLAWEPPYAAGAALEKAKKLKPKRGN